MEEEGTEGRGRHGSEVEGRGRIEEGWVTGKGEVDGKGRKGEVWR